MKLEFSKIIVLCGFILELLVIIFACVMMWRTADISGLTYISIISGSTILSSVSFYYWKAKAENKSKTAKSFVKAIAETYGIESAIEIMRIVMEAE